MIEIKKFIEFLLYISIVLVARDFLVNKIDKVPWSLHSSGYMDSKEIHA